MAKKGNRIIQPGTLTQHKMKQSPPPLILPLCNLSLLTSLLSNRLHLKPDFITNILFNVMPCWM